MKNTYFKAAIASMAIGSLVFSATAFAEDGARAPMPRFPLRQSTTTPPGMPGGNMHDDSTQDDRQDPKELQVCIDAYKQAQKSAESTQNSQDTQNSQAMRELQKKMRQARFDIQTKFTLDMFNAETAFIDAKNATLDAKDQDALKTAQDTFNKAKKSITQTKNDALKALEKDNKSALGQLKTSGKPDWQSFMQKQMQNMPEQCRPHIEPFMPGASSTPSSTLGSVKGAFIKAGQKIKRQLGK